MNRTKNGYVVVVIDALTQRKSFVKLKDVKLDPENLESVTLAQALDAIAQNWLSQQKEIESLKKENKKLKRGLSDLIKTTAYVNLKK